MLHSLKTYKESATYHREVHKTLTDLFLGKMSKKTDFKLKVQKASIQLVGKEPFSVIGYRRSKGSIFVEFYSHDGLEHPRISQTIIAKNGLPLHRILIEKESDINDELLVWITESERIAVR